MADDAKDFLARWSRLKRERAAATSPPTAAASGAQAPELPPLDQLTPDSDFKGFMHAKVKDSVRRAALKKLFADPRFNIMDDLDIYIGDYTEGETISPEMLADLQHSKTTLFGRPEEPQAEKALEPAPDAPQAATAGPPLEETKAASPPVEQAAPRTEAAPSVPGATEDGRNDDGAAG